MASSFTTLLNGLNDISATIHDIDAATQEPTSRSHIVATQESTIEDFVAATQELTTKEK